MEIKLAGMQKNTIYFKPDGKEELIRLESGKFYWKGEAVEDTQKIYERFCEYLKIAERSIHP